MSYPPPPGGPGSAYPQGHYPHGQQHPQGPYAQQPPGQYPPGQGGWATPRPAGGPYQPQGGPGTFGAPPSPPGAAPGGPGPAHAPYPRQPAPPGGGGGGDQGKGLKRAVLGVVVLALLVALGVGGLAVTRALGDNALPTAGGGAHSEQLIGPQDVTELLEGRSQALRSGDEEAYLAPFTGEARKTQRKLFRNLRKVPFAQAEFSVLNQTGTGDDDYGDGATVTLDVAFVHKIQNVDVRPVSEWYRWVIKRASEDTGPRITKVGPSPGAYGSKSYVYYPAPWDLYEDMHVVRQAHSITISDKKYAADTDRYAPYIEKAAKDDIELWRSTGPPGVETPTGFVAVLEPDRETYTSLYAAGSTEWEAGQSVPMPTFDADFGGDEDDLEYGGARIKMDTSLSRFTSATHWQSGVADISHHEFAHAIVQPLEAATEGFGTGAANTRWWAVEGFAEYTAMRFDPERSAWEIRNHVAGRPFDGELPESPGFSDQVSRDYTLAHLAIRFIAEKSGETAAFRFVADHYRDPDGLDEQLRRAVGMGESEFEAAWATYVRSLSR